MAQQRDKSMPIVQYKSGFIEASIWRNEIIQKGKIKVRHSVHLEKQFKASDGRYKTTSNYFPHELPRAIMLLQQCYEYIMLSSENREDDNAALA